MSENIVSFQEAKQQKIQADEIHELALLNELALHVCAYEIHHGPISADGSPLYLILHDLVQRAKKIRSAVWDEPHRADGDDPA